MVKKILILLLAIGFGNPFPLLAQKKAIAKVLDTQRLAWNKGDLKAFMQTYWKNDSLIFVGKNGLKYGWQTTFENYQKSYPTPEHMGTLTFHLLRIDVLGKNDAHVIGNWHLQRKSDTPQGIFTLLLHKFKDGWKITVDHTQ